MFRVDTVKVEAKQKQHRQDYRDALRFFLSFIRSLEKENLASHVLKKKEYCSLTDK